MKLGFLSDLHLTTNGVHIEYAIQQLTKLIAEKGLSYVFIAGDTTNNPNNTKLFVDKVNENLKDYLIKAEVYYIYGNHEFWHKTLTIETANEQDVYYAHNKVVNVNEDTIVYGFNGWFDYSYIMDTEVGKNSDVPKNKNTLEEYGHIFFDLDRIGDIGATHEQMFMQNYNQLEKVLEENADKRILLFTHFVPDEQFVLFKGEISWDVNNAFMGSQKVGDLISKYENVTDITFGHTHTRFGTVNYKGVNYHCRPLGYKDYDGTWSDDFPEELERSLTIIEI